MFTFDSGFFKNTATLLWLSAAIVGIMMLNALFHLADAALSGLRIGKIREMAEAKDEKTLRLGKIAEKHAAYYTTCRVGEQLCRVGIYGFAAIASLWVSYHLAPNGSGFLGALGLTFLVVLAVALVNFVVFETAFSGLGRKNPEAVATRLMPILNLFHILLAPFVWVFTGISNLIARRLGVASQFATPIVTEDDLRELVDAGGESGELIEDEREMIHSIIEFTDTIAREVMTPRTDIDACDIASTAQDVAKLIDETGHTRIPIYQGTIDRVVGIVHAKDLLKTLMNGNGHEIKNLMRSALFIPESKDLHGLLELFRKERTMIAIVQDEFGGTAGLVTMEDLVEEIVGQIVDEYDIEEPEVQSVADGWIIDGKANLDDVNDEIGSAFESEEFDTLGGYVFGLFGRQPEDGEEIEDGPWALRVTETDGRRVLKVLARKP